MSRLFLYPQSITLEDLAKYFSIVFLLSISISLNTMAAPPGGHLNINEVFVDLIGETITITGEDFDQSSPLVVMLGEFGSLPIIDSTADMIIAELPSGAAPCYTFYKRNIGKVANNYSLFVNLLF